MRHLGARGLAPVLALMILVVMCVTVLVATWLR